MIKPELRKAHETIKEFESKQNDHLDFGSLFLKKIPEEVFELRNIKNIKTLVLIENQLTELPKEISLLENLTDLAVMGNHLKKLPKEIGQLKNLDYLDLRDNRLTELPKEIAKLKNLKHLMLGENRLTKLPKEITQLENLEGLDIRVNRFTKLPKEICKLKSLRGLELGNNQLTQLPKEIALLQNLHTLNLENNQLIQLPKEIAQLENLKYFSLDGNNHLIFPPPPIVKKGAQVILNYLKTVDKKTKLWTSKMVLVGEVGAGKTCLLDALEGKNFDLGRETTNGINFRKLYLPCPGKKDICIELNVWDFGGKDIYRATHQFYLTNHALFVLVWNARLGYETGKIYKWLETIEAVAPDSPILIVATHSKGKMADSPRSDILSKYPNKVHFFEVDNEIKQGIKELKEFIQKFAYNLKNVGTERPSSWVIAAKTIKTLNEIYISEKKLFRVFQESGVNKSDYENLAVYLHERGDIIYYPDEENLKETILIKPAWLSQHTAKILESEEVSKQAGILSESLMSELATDCDLYFQDKLITLMENFDISFKNDIDTSLIVEKLKYEEHSSYKKLWETFEPSEKEIVFKYELNTIPAGIPSWFIARTHRFSIYIHWRNGVLLEDKEKKHLGLVIARPKIKEVWLKVKGIMPYYFLALLRDTLELTFNRFKGLIRKTKVPCPGHNGKPCTYFFDLEDLEEKLTKKAPEFTIKCPKATENIDVEIMKMLFGLSYEPKNQTLVEQFTKQVKHTIDEQTKLLVIEMDKKNEDLIKTIQTKNEELIKIIHLDFIKNYQMQQKLMDHTCPNLFTLEPKERSIITNPLEVNEYKLQLYCQMPGHVHPVEEGCYTLKSPKKWLVAIAPYYNEMLKKLKWILPVLMPGAKALLNDTVIDSAKMNLKTLKDYIEKLPSIDIENKEIPKSVNLRMAEGSELRLIRQLLEKKNKNHHWGGLERVVTPEGYILWLCKEHTKEYK